MFTASSYRTGLPIFLFKLMFSCMCLLHHHIAHCQQTEAGNQMKLKYSAFSREGQIYHHIPKYSHYKSYTELDRCNSTFRLIRQQVYDPEKQCRKFSSQVIGFEQLIQFYYALKQSNSNYDEIIFPLRQVVKNGTRFRVTLSQYIVYSTMEVALKNVKGIPESFVVCVRMSCDPPQPAPLTPQSGSSSHNTACPNSNIFGTNKNSTEISPAQYQSWKQSSTWFTIALGLIVFAVLVVLILIVIYCKKFSIASGGFKSIANLNSQQNSPSQVSTKENKNFDTINSFDLYDMLRKMGDQPAPPSQAHSIHSVGLGDLYAKPTCTSNVVGNARAQENFRNSNNNCNNINNNPNCSSSASSRNRNCINTSTTNSPRSKIVFFNDNTSHIYGKLSPINKASLNRNYDNPIVGGLPKVNPSSLSSPSATTSSGAPSRSIMSPLPVTTVLATDRLELLNNKHQTMPIRKKQYCHLNSPIRSCLIPPVYASMDVTNDSTSASNQTNSSFRSVKYIPPLKLVENDF